MLLTFTNDVDLWRRRRQSFAVSAYLALLPLLATLTEAAMYGRSLMSILSEGDSCTMKGVTGVCKLSSECTLLEAAIKRGDFTVEEIERCGFAINEEIICCPIKDFTKPDTHGDFWQQLLTTTTTTTAAPDFWENLIPSTTRSTTSRGDFWEGILPSTTTTAKPDFWLNLLTTTTTPKPLIVGDMELDKNSEFYDFSKLLIGEQKPENAKSSRITNQNTLETGTKQRTVASTSPQAQTDMSTSNSRQPSQPVRNLVPQMPGESVSNRSKSRPNRDEMYTQTNHAEEFGPQRARDQFGSNQRLQDTSNLRNSHVMPNMNAVPTLTRPIPGQMQSSNNNRLPEAHRAPHIDANNARPLLAVNNNNVRHLETHAEVIQLNQVRQTNPNQHLSENMRLNQPLRPDRNEHLLESTWQYTAQASGGSNHAAQNQVHREASNRDHSEIVWPSHLKPDRSNTITQNQDHQVGSHQNPSNQILPNNIQSLDRNKHTSESTRQTSHLEIDHNKNSQHSQSPTPHHNQPVSQNSPPNKLQSAEQYRYPSENTRQHTDRQSSNIQQPILHTQEQRPVLHNQQSSNVVWPNQASGLGRSPNPNNLLTTTPPSTHQKNIDNMFFTGEGLRVWNNSQNHASTPEKQLSTHPPSLRQLPRNEQPNRIVWPSEDNRAKPTPKPVYNSNMDPIEWVNNNLKNLGMDIVKAEERPNGMYVEPTTTHKPTRQQQRPVEQPNRGHADYVDGGSKMVNGHLEDAQNSFNKGKSIHTADSRPPIPTSTPTSSSTSTESSSSRPVINRLDERPAVRACRQIDEGLQPSLSPHIIGGTKVELGEFPHMAAIGYSPIAGNDEGPYDFRCGGTLIDKRFVLTAAHCVNSREAQAVIVRLGVTNFTDPEQMRDAVEIRIKTTHIHPEYSNSRKYNDIALLELERDVSYSENVYPTCLYMDLNDPPAKEMLYVTGWGVINTSTRQYSNILLKAPLQVVSVDRCNESYIEMGLNRQLSRGVDNTQLCATDTGYSKDACQGDSGGPLQMIVDESSKKYRIVGIVSTGFSCATSTPGLYTRVAAFVDYIEDIVWPRAALK